MERWRLADILPISKAMLKQLFGDEPSPLHFRFQAASTLNCLQTIRQPENSKAAWHNAQRFLPDSLRLDFRLPHFPIPTNKPAHRNPKFRWANFYLSAHNS
ncbi:hypothetical protein [Kingella oralis]|uniref:hypothetical protein n=1 Tax=Kingella oralis TaxID=505 RepID=UPI002D7F944D|nr:hypothetical protein [Kingella oralis]